MTDVDVVLLLCSARSIAIGKSSLSFANLIFSFFSTLYFLAALSLHSFTVKRKKEENHLSPASNLLMSSFKSSFSVFIFFKAFWDAPPSFAVLLFCPSGIRGVGRLEKAVTKSLKCAPRAGVASPNECVCPYSR